MALYRTKGIKYSQAKLSDYGEESQSHWSGTYKAATADRKHLKALGFDASSKKYDCPKDKKALIDFLNLVAK